MASHRNVAVQSCLHRFPAAKRRQHIAAGVSPQEAGPQTESREAATAMRADHDSPALLSPFHGYSWFLPCSAGLRLQLHAVAASRLTVQNSERDRSEEYGHTGF